MKKKIYKYNFRDFFFKGFVQYSIVVQKKCFAFYCKKIKCKSFSDEVRGYFLKNILKEKN